MFLKLSEQLAAFQRQLHDDARLITAALGAFWDGVDSLIFEPERVAFPPVRTQYYGHGAFMGAAPALVADPTWRRILGFLMPDVFDAVRKQLDEETDTARLMTMMENNPVLAAFGTVRAASARGAQEDPNHLVGLEWDVFVDTDLVKAQARAQTPEASAEVMDRVLDTALIAHAGAFDTVQESLGFSQYADVRDTPKTEFGGVEMDAWLDLFGRALALARAEDFDALISAMAREPRSPSKEACMRHTFASPWPVARVVDEYRRVTGRPYLSIIIDIKSRASTPAFLTALVQHLNGFGVHVAAIGSFDIREIDGVADTPQRLGEIELAGPREVLFFHYAGDLQVACKEGRLSQGQSVMFNGGSLLRFTDRVPGGTQHDFFVRPRVLEELEGWRRKFDLQIGIYVQEGDCEAGAATALSDMVEAWPDTFALGFAWGGLRDEVGLPPGVLARAGYGGQMMLALVGEARPWELEED